MVSRRPGSGYLFDRNGDGTGAIRCLIANPDMKKDCLAVQFHGAAKSNHFRSRFRRWCSHGFQHLRQLLSRIVRLGESQLDRCHVVRRSRNGPSSKPPVPTLPASHTQLLRVHNESEQSVSRPGYYILLAVEFIGNGAVAQGGAQIRVPEGLASGRVEGHEVVLRVGGED